MRRSCFQTSSLLLLAALNWGMQPGAFGHAGPFDGSRFRGSIAWTCDGNHNDEDDWAASPLALALFAEFGVKDRLVHFDYNNILHATNPGWEDEHRKSVLGAVERWRFDPSHFYDCQRDLDSAVKSLASAIQRASRAEPLYIVVAGPVEVLYRALQLTDPGKRQYVYCISHSRWNDGFARNYTFPFNKRVIIESGVNWVQIPDQNRGLATSPWGRRAIDQEWAPWRWLEQSPDERLRFLWDRLWSVTRADASDAGMAWFLLTGDEEATIEKVRAVLERGQRPVPVRYRRKIRLEAENFTSIQGFQLVDTDREASHQLHVKLNGREGELDTRYSQPYAPPRGKFRASIRYRAAGRCQVRIQADGSPNIGAEPLPATTRWSDWHSRAFELREPHHLRFEWRCDPTATLEVDYVDLELSP